MSKASPLEWANIERPLDTPMILRTQIMVSFKVARGDCYGSSTSQSRSNCVAGMNISVQL